MLSGFPEGEDEVAEIHFIFGIGWGWGIVCHFRVKIWTLNVKRLAVAVWINTLKLLNVKIVKAAEERWRVKSLKACLP